MTTQLHDTGEEYILDKLDGESFQIGLYHDGEVSGDTTNGDDLTDSATLADISTEPSDGNYSRVTAILNTSDGGGGDWQLDNSSKVPFDVQGTTGRVDAYVVIKNFSSDDKGTTEDHIINTGNLSQEYKLVNLDTLEISAGGVGVEVT